MPSLARILVLCLAVLAAVGAAGCGNKQDVLTQGDTEGLYIDVDELTYQVQLSRILEPASLEDQAYLRGLAEGVGLASDEVWFAVFLRVENETDQVHRSADRFEIVDTTDKTYRPVGLDRNVNVFLYEPESMAPGVIIPRPDTPAFNGPVQGSLILFRVKISSLYNRPLEFRISNSRGGGTTGIIDLDV